MKKKVLCLTSSLALIISLSINAFAFGWQQSGERWWYGTNEDNTTYYNNGWQMIDGAYYYFDADGYMLANTTTPDGYWVGANGAMVQNAQGAVSESTAVQNQLGGYLVSAPTNVHWTDEFELSWEFGKTQDGTVHHRYGYRVIDDSTNTPLNNGSGTMNPSGTSVDLFLATWTAEKMQTGSYSFIVYAIDENKNQISPEVRSESKFFTRPNITLTTPANLRWEGTSLGFDLTGNSKELADMVHFQLMYSPTEDGVYEKKHESSLEFDKKIDAKRFGMDTPGYYKFRAFVNTRDPQKALASQYSDYSEAYHFTG